MVRPERRQTLRDALADLARYRTTYTEAAFLASRDAQRMVLQALYVAVQACLGEAFERCRAHGLEPGTSYREAFLALARAGLLEAGLAAKLADWASFRNVLAHFYPVVDLRRVYQGLAEIGDLEAFASWLDAPAAAG
jgi:uncharacterized protein YutE (UPF0331/DUF86 family)